MRRNAARLKCKQKLRSFSEETNSNRRKVLIRNFPSVRIFVFGETTKFLLFTLHKKFLKVNREKVESISESWFADRLFEPYLWLSRVKELR